MGPSFSSFRVSGRSRPKQACAEPLPPLPLLLRLPKRDESDSGREEAEERAAEEVREASMPLGSTPLGVSGT